MFKFSGNNFLNNDIYYTGKCGPEKTYLYIVDPFKINGCEHKIACKVYLLTGFYLKKVLVITLS